MTTIEEKAFGYTSTKAVESFKMYCVAGSEAETYAKNNKITYELITETPAPAAKTKLTADNVKLAAASYTADGTAKTPAVTVTVGTKTLVNDTDYTIAYSNNVNAGTATVTVTGKGDYEGTVTKTFTITAPAPAAKTKLTADNVKLAAASHTADGTAKTPAVTVTVGTKTLVNGTDYTIAYSNNVNAGTATVTVAGKGDYEGTVTKTFTINAAESEKIKITLAKGTFSSKSITYSGKAKMPKLTLTYNGKTLVKNKDYTLAVKDAVKVGKASLLITGIGDYTGRGLMYYYIVPVKPTISKVTSTAAKKAAVKWSSNTTASGYQIQISLKKNFSTKKSYNVSKNTAYKATITKLTSGKTYYVRMRAYKIIDGVRKYSAYSAVKSVKVK